MNKNIDIPSLILQDDGTYAVIAVETKAGGTYKGLAPIEVDNTNMEIGIDLSNISSKTELNNALVQVEKDITANTTQIDMIDTLVNGHADEILKNKNDIESITTDAVSKTTTEKQFILSDVNVKGKLQAVQKPEFDVDVLRLGDGNDLFVPKTGNSTFGALVGGSLVSNKLYNREVIASNANGKTATNKDYVDAQVKVNADGINLIKTEQGTQNVNIETNKKEILVLSEQNKAQLNWTGKYDNTKTYQKNDVVTNDLLAYLSEIDNNTRPLTDTTAWFPFTPSASVDLTNYFTKIEIYELLRPLEVRLDAIESFDEQITAELKALEALVDLKADKTTVTNAIEAQGAINTTQTATNEAQKVINEDEDTRLRSVEFNMGNKGDLRQTAGQTWEGTNRFDNLAHFNGGLWADGNINVKATGGGRKAEFNIQSAIDSAGVESIKLNASAPLEIIGNWGTKFTNRWGRDAKGNKFATFVDFDNSPTLNIQTPTVPTAIANKEYVDNAVSGSAKDWVLISNVNSTEDSDLNTKQEITLTKNVNQYSEFRIIGRGLSPKTGQFIMDFKVLTTSYGQGTNTNNYLSANTFGKTMKWVNVSGGGASGNVWLYLDFALQSIWGKEV